MYTSVLRSGSVYYFIYGLSLSYVGEYKCTVSNSVFYFIYGLNQGLYKTKYVTAFLVLESANMVAQGQS